MKVKSNIYIPLHSIVDIITNSSSEIFATATLRSGEQIEKFINAILISGNSNVTCKELFDIKVVKLFTQNELEEMSKEETKKLLDDPHYPKSYYNTPDEADSYARECGAEHYVVSVIPKVENEYTKFVAKILNDYAPFYDLQINVY